jgi:hypothetical protein
MPDQGTSVQRTRDLNRVPGHQIPHKTTSCSVFSTQRSREMAEEDMCHTDLYAYIKVFGNENQRRRLVELRSKVRRKHLLPLYREVRRNNNGGNNNGGNGKNNRNNNGGNGKNNRNNNGGNGKNNRNNNGGNNNGSSYFKSNEFLNYRLAYALFSDPDLKQKLNIFYNKYGEKWTLNLWSNIVRITETISSYETDEERAQFEEGLKEFIIHEQYPARQTRQFLRTLFGDL